MPITAEFKGRKRPKTWNMDSEEAYPFSDLANIVLLQADGKELDVILTSFANIPRTKAASQVWVGPFAHQILANLGSLMQGSRVHGNSFGAATAPMEA